MSVENQKKRQDMDKLRKILDNPNDPGLAHTLHAEDASLDSVRRRLSRTQTASARVRTPASLQPHVTIRQQQFTTAATATSAAVEELPLWTPVESTPVAPMQMTRVPKAPMDFSDQDLFEIEFPESSIPQFVLVDETAASQAHAQTEPVTYVEPVPQTPLRQTQPLPNWEIVTTQTPTEQPPVIPLQEFTDVTPKAPLAAPQLLPPPEPRQTWRQRRAAKKTARIQAREAKRREELSRTKPAPQPESAAPVEEPLQQPAATHAPKPSMPPAEATEAFRAIPSIDDRTADLLFRSGYCTVEQLHSTPISALVKIKGIKRKHAKQIKKDVDASFIIPKTRSTTHPAPVSKRQPKRKTPKEEDEGTEWESYVAPRESDLPSFCTYEGYTLYQRETKVGRKKTTVHVFSKTHPKEGTPVSLPDGFVIDVNKRTGIPYLKKKK